MATLESFAESGTTVSRNDELGIIVITGGVLEIDGALDALGKAYIIYCRAGGGIRSKAGASGTLGGYAETTYIIEEDDAHRYGGDNFNSVNARFSGDTTNTLKYSNVTWIVEYKHDTAGNNNSGRSDWDTYVGAQSDGSAGCAVEFNGVYLIQRQAASGGTDGNASHNNHYGSANVKITVNSHLGYGLKIRNETNGPGYEFSKPPSSSTTIEGIAFDSYTAANNNGSARLIVRLSGLSAPMVLKRLNTPSVASVNGGASNKLRLEDPVGVPDRVTGAAAWNGAHGIFEIWRTVPFSFSGVAVPASTVMHATPYSANTNGEAATGSASGSSGSVLVKTNTAPHNNLDGFQSCNGYDFQMVGLPFRKYSHALSVPNAPTTINAALTADVLPDGTAITAFNSGNVANAAELYRALKTWAVANRNEPDATSPLVTLSSTGAIVLDTDAELRLASAGESDPQATLISETSEGVYSVRCASTGVGAGGGVTLLDAGTANALPSGTRDLLMIPYRDSSGTSSAVILTGATDHFAGLYKPDANKTELGSHDFTNGAITTIFVSPTDSVAGVKLAYNRPGRVCLTRTLNLSAGGTFNIDFGDLPIDVDQDGNALYDSSASVTGLSAAFPDAATGRCYLEIPDRTVSVKELYKAFQDGLSTAAGARFCAFGLVNLKISEYAGQAANLTLGPDIQLRRAAVSGNNAGVAAIPSGGIGGKFVDTSNNRGEVMFLPSLGEVEAKIDAVKADTEIVIEQNKLTMQNLPRHFYSPWVPENPAVFFVYGQLRLHDVNKRNWAITNGDGNLVINQDGDGYGTFDGNTIISASLNRLNDQGSLVNFAEECTAAFRIKPIDEDGTFVVAELGALRLFLVMSSGTGRLAVGSLSPTHNYTHAVITADRWHDVVLTFQRNPNNSSYPYIRLSASNGYPDDNTNSPNVQTLTKWNFNADGTPDANNEVFGQIASHTGYFNFGHSANGFKGDMSNVYFHPSATAINYEWKTGGSVRAAGFNVHKQIWHGLPCDSSEGLSDDLLEETADEINAKTFTLDEYGLAPWRTNTSDLTSATGSIGKLLAERRNPPTSGDIADAVLDEATSDHSTEGSLGAVIQATKNEVDGLPNKGTIADAVLDELLSGHTTDGSLGKKLADIPTETYTIPTPPTKEEIADQVWDEATTNHTTTGSFGKRLQDTSTHNAPADSPQASEVAQAVWQRVIPDNPTTNSYGAKLKDLTPGATAAQIWSESLGSYSAAGTAGEELKSLSGLIERTIDQNRLVITSVPLRFHAPLTDKCAAVGLVGQERQEDVEENEHPVTLTGIDRDIMAEGLMIFDGSNSHVDFGLTRSGVLNNKEIICLAQIKPDPVETNAPTPLASFGEVEISMGASFPSGANPTRSYIRVGDNLQGAKYFNLGEWNELAIYIRKQEGSHYPIIKISINGEEVETWNDGSNDYLAVINDSTSIFRFGAHGTGNSSSGFCGRARAIFVNPNDAVSFDGAGWDMPINLTWNSYFQQWQGGGLMDRVRGLPSGADVSSVSAETVELMLAALVEDGVSFKKAIQIIAAALGATATVAGSDVTFAAIGSSATRRLRLTMGTTAGQRTASVIDPSSGAEGGS